jgi:hypothetical protein
LGEAIKQIRNLRIEKIKIKIEKNNLGFVLLHNTSYNEFDIRSKY